MGPIMLLVAGAMGVIGFTIIEPMYVGFGEPASALGWGSPGQRAIAASSAAMVGVMVVIVLYMIFSPIQNDRRQEVR